MTGTEVWPTQSVMSGACQRFAVSLLQALGVPFGQENVCISPTSVYIALLMAQAGARGATATEIGSALGLADMAHSQVVDEYDKFRHLLYQEPHFNAYDQGKPAEFTIANALFSDIGLEVLPQYVSVCNNAFDAFVNQVNFADPTAADVVNSWVSAKTNGKITELVEPPLDSVKLILVNAVYFLNGWRNPFRDTLTKPQPFQLQDGTRIDVHMMRTYSHLDYFETDAFEVIKLPYADPRFSMSFYLPKLGQPPAAILNHISAGSSSQTFSERYIELGLPRYTIKWRTELVPPLQKLGVRSLFSAANADLTGMAPQAELFISKVLHQTYIRVDEEGTEAAAATAMFAAPGSSPGMPKPLIFDRPFVAVLWHEPAATPLFITMVSKPDSVGTPTWIES